MISLEERKARLRAQRAAEGEEARDRAEEARAELAVQSEDSMAEFSARVHREGGIMVGTVRTRADLESLAGTLEEAQAAAAPRAPDKAQSAFYAQAYADEELVAANPELQAAIAKLPEGRWALIQAFKQAREEAIAKERAKVHMHIDQLRKIAATGDEGAAGVLAVRVESLRMQQWTPRARALAVQAGLSEEDMAKYGPDPNFSGQR
jgi:hypothetical protein